MESSLPTTDFAQLDAAAPSKLLTALTALTLGSLTTKDAEAIDGLNGAENTALDAVVHNILKKNYLARFVETHYQITVDNVQAAAAVPTMTIRCNNCNHIVNLPPPDTRWYCVTRGLRIGYVRGWDAVKKLVLHVPDNKYVTYGDKEMARKAFIIAVASREASVVVTGEFAMAYDALPEKDGFLYP